MHIILYTVSSKPHLIHAESNLNDVIVLVWWPLLVLGIHLCFITSLYQEEQLQPRRNFDDPETLKKLDDLVMA